MKAVILAGGLGTRLSEETSVRPKPMVEIGGRPILWHILKMYAHYGVNDFIICCGYKGYYIKEYFSNYFLHMSDVTYDMRDNRMEVMQQRAEPWRVTLVDTGEHSMTGGRLLRVAPYLREEEAFCFTYGDGVSDLDIAASIAFHRQHGRWATLTAVRPSSRFGLLELQGGRVLSFQEKPRYDGSVVNGGFYVLSPKVFQFLQDDGTIWEQGPLQRIVAAEQLMAYEHAGFWYPMDTLRDKHYLEELWTTGQAPWKRWE
ncbi:glucose-1-phosphate cytidylyltransferase [Candidatus Magnetaquicoccus inordinatus]|uniref:glucose-1-phosphate cytidylyltransferase n=1 Tax=Candidatus Magnetaquicoccus inordinatus TaxID=2496818 RepID=UPI00102C8315|nr:glucose-1-phosphate cytidylyltransferase [Candidatus Magnetaquicoccus inordinatus]